MKFNIIFYTGSGSQPGTVVWSYIDVAYSFSYTGIKYNYGDWYYMYYFEATLNPCCDLSNGWVSIQNIYGPNDYLFLLINSIDVNLLCYQNSYKYIYDVSFILIGGGGGPPKTTNNT